MPHHLHPRIKLHIPVKLGDRAADSVAAFVGSWRFVGIHTCWFAAWIVLRVESYPFGLLTLIVSLEAIFLSTFVMLSQNRQAARDRARDDLESEEVQSMFDNHLLLLRINEQQLEILKMLREDGKRQ